VGTATSNVQDDGPRKEVYMYMCVCVGQAQYLYYNVFYLTPADTWFIWYPSMGVFSVQASMHYSAFVECSEVTTLEMRILLLLARLMSQYCFACWRMSSVVVVCRRL